MWELRYSRDEFSIKAAIEKGRDLPEWYLEEPFICGGDYFYLKAWQDLNSCRSVGMSQGPIPWRDILMYAHYHQLDMDLVDPFIQILRIMDTAYLDWCNDEDERKRKK